MHEREDRCAKSGASWRASCTTRAMASSSSSSIEKLVFIAPLRPGLNHRCSHNFVVVSSPPLPIQYLPGPARTSCLIFRCYGLVYCYGPAPCIFQVPRYREVSRMKILPAKAGRRRGGGERRAVAFPPPFSPRSLLRPTFVVTRNRLVVEIGEPCPRARPSQFQPSTSIPFTMDGDCSRLFLRVSLSNYDYHEF